MENQIAETRAETRVGYMTTSLLENECLNYLKSNPNDLDFLIKYDRLRWYNQGIDCGKGE